MKKNYLYAGNYPEDELLKESNSLSKIIFYEKIYKIRNGISIKTINFITRLLRRYPYMVVVDILFLVCVFILV